MEKGFICGMIAGVLAGAIVVANSYKARKLVKDGQECVKQKVSEMTEKADKKKSDNKRNLKIRLRYFLRFRLFRPLRRLLYPARLCPYTRPFRILKTYLSENRRSV